MFKLIGLFVVIKFIYKNKEMFMDKEAFWDAVHNLRKGIFNWTKEAQCRELDNIIKSTEGIMEQQEQSSIENDITKLLKRIKEAKEKEVLSEKAKELFKQLKETV